MTAKVKFLSLAIVSGLAILVSADQASAWPGRPNMAYSQAQSVSPAGFSNAFASAFQNQGFGSAMSSAMSAGPGGQSSAFSNAFSAPGHSQSFSSSFSGGPNGFSSSFSGAINIGGRSHAFSHSFTSPSFPAPMPCLP